MSKMQGQCALITGGGSGIGRVLTHALSAAGVRVAIADIHADHAAQVLDEIKGQGIVLQGDVSNSKIVAGWFEEIRRQFGKLDILINNAGHTSDRPEFQEKLAVIAGEIMSGEGQKTSYDATTSLSDEVWQKMMNVHLNGTFYCTREALKMMTPARYGRIINQASVGGTAGIVGAPEYSAAKGGIIAFTKSVAKEVAAFGITVNAIAPGYIDTAFLANMSDMARSIIISSTPMLRLGRPDELVPIVLLLADPENSFMTGQILSPNGGLVT